MKKCVLSALGAIALAGCGASQAPRPPTYGYVAEAPAVTNGACVLRYRLATGATGPVDVILTPAPAPGTLEVPARSRLLAARMALCRNLKAGDRFELEHFGIYGPR